MLICLFVGRSVGQPVVFELIVEGFPKLTTCSSREGYDSSRSSATTRASRKIGLTIGKIGSSGGCGTFQ